jgi:Domain of unknown function (DUF5666)
MKQQTARFHRPAMLVTAAATLTLLASMEGSAGIQGTGHMSVIAVGRITAFGSIFVDGVEYDIAQAGIQINGQPGQANQLEVGQVVRVQAAASGGAQGSATAVSYTASVVGPVSQVDPAASTFTVLGQTVQVDGTTLFGDGIQPASLAALQVGTNVDVSAFATASGGLQASRIDLPAPSTPLQVEGTVEALDTGAMTFWINNLQVDYSQASVQGQIVNGATATVSAQEYPTAGALHVTRVQAAVGVGGQAGEEGHLEGLVTSISSNGSFYVGSQLIVTGSSTHFVLHGQTLAPNLSLRVHGRFNAAGALAAEMVQASPQSH